MAVPRTPAGIVVGPDEGEVITRTERRDLVLIADLPDISVSRMRYVPGEWGPDPHVHREHTDSFYLLEGELTFVLGREDERITVGPDTFVAAPAGVVHSFGNEGDAEARFLNFHSPQAGFGEYLRGRRDGRDVPFDSFDPPDDGGLPFAEAIVSGPGEGERLLSGSRVTTVKCERPDLFLSVFEIGDTFSGPPLHSHDDQVDAFYVLDGDIDVTVEGSSQVAGPGTLAAIPRDVEHTFDNLRGQPARFLNLHAPEAGFADFMRRISD